MHRIDRIDTETIAFEFEGETILAQKGDSIAAALIAAGHKTFRTSPIDNTARGPFCMMGVCFECLVEIDGIGNQQACMKEILEGMKVKKQQGAVDIAIEMPTYNADKAST